MIEKEFIVGTDELILITGANSFIGLKVVETLLSYGFKNLRCFVRSANGLTSLRQSHAAFCDARMQIVQGNLLSREDCDKISEGVSVIYHLAAGTEKTFPGCVLNSVVTTRNLLDATLHHKKFKRFLNVSSFAVYSNLAIARGRLLDESCELDSKPELRYEAYSYGKTKQEELVREYGKKYNIPYVTVRPGAVYGPGKSQITARVGIDTFGFFIHLGGANRIPLTYVDNCAEAILLAGLVKGVEGEAFNIVDDDCPTSRAFLNMYKKNVEKFASVYIPYPVFYFLCYLWESYAKWSKGQLPPVFNRRRCATYWKGNLYSNEKLKTLLGWNPKVAYDEALKRYFTYLKGVGKVDA
jgi:nucleoside-diphosphate-sugar epimerase